MRSIGAALVMAALVLGTTVPASGEAEPAGAEPVTLDAAQLRWGLSNEANNSAFAPGTVNHFSAGRIADPGAGSQTLTAPGTTWSNGRPAGWSASSGRVAVEKFDGSTYRPATWDGLSTDSSGHPLGSPLAGTFSNHQLVFDGGSGTVDAAAGDASISWQGDATVLFYSGMSFFYISDPHLTVADGIGKLTATLSGFGSSQTDTGAWKSLPSTEVTLADLGPVDLSLKDGFTVTPRYLGVGVTGVPQISAGPHFGSFPQSFVTFQDTVGSAAFWYSSGGSADQFKPTLPMTVSYDAARAVLPPSPASTGGRRPDTVRNDVKKRPTRKPVEPAEPAASPVAQTPVPSTSSSPQPAVAPSTTVPAATAPAFVQVAQPTTVLAAEVGAESTDRSSRAYWWLGTVLLALAASTLASTFAGSAIAARRAPRPHPHTARP